MHVIETRSEIMCNAVGRALEFSNAGQTLDFLAQRAARPIDATRRWTHANKRKVIIRRNVGPLEQA